MDMATASNKHYPTGRRVQQQQIIVILHDADKSGMKRGLKR